MTLIGKALGGGFYPISAVLTNRDVLGVLKPGEHGSTFGGNPLACAVARESLRVLTEEGLIENSARLGARLLSALRAGLGSRVKAIRGRGLMIAVELHPAAGGARRVCESLQARGLLAKETHQNTIRIAPPLIVAAQEVDWIAEQFAAAIPLGLLGSVLRTDPVGGAAGGIAATARLPFRWRRRHSVRWPRSRPRRARRASAPVLASEGVRCSAPFPARTRRQGPGLP